MMDSQAIPQPPLGGTLPKHIPLVKWLDMLGLPEYQDLFRTFSGVENMLHLTEADIRDLGVKNSAHRARIISSLVKMRQKLLQRQPQPSCDTVHCTPEIYRGVTPPRDVNINHYSCTTVKQATYQPLDMPAENQTGRLTNSAVRKRDMPFCPPASPSDLSRYLWYHGTIPRPQAETLVVSDGAFLIRDSISQPGDYVLTVCWQGAPLHFMLNKQVQSDGVQLKVQYQFESTLFDTVPQLIQFHVDNKAPVSDASGAILSHPVERSGPVEYCDIRLAALEQSFDGRHLSPSVSPQRSSSNRSDSPRVDRRLRIDGQPRRVGSQPLLSLDYTDGNLCGQRDKFGSLPSIAPQPPGKVEPPHTLPKSLQNFRAGSEPMLSPTSALGVKKNLFVRNTADFAGSDGDLTKPPPAKPSRVPTIKYSPKTGKPIVVIRNKSLYEDDGRDYSDYDQVKSWPSALKQSFDSGDNSQENGKTATTDVDIGDYDVPRSLDGDSSYYDVPKSSKESSPLRGSQRDSTCNELPVKLPRQVIKLPDADEKSYFDVEHYTSGLLTPNNKPLESSAVTTIRMLLLECDATQLSQHITHIDLDLLKVTGSHDFGVCVFSGLEYMTLPQGQQLRLDLLERFHCLKLFVATSLLTCTKLGERSKLLHKWILVASHLKGIMGNLFSFSAIINGLQLEQISRLTQTWSQLKQNFVDSDATFTTRLQPLLRSMDEAGSMLPLQNITVPHIVPLIQLLLRPPCDLEAEVMSWESTSPDLGFDIMLAHLDTARIITEHCGLYRVTATNLLKSFFVDPHLRDMFCAETHMKLMWGAKGALVDAPSRYAKFEQVLTVLAERLEPKDSALTNRETSL